MFVLNHPLCVLLCIIGMFAPDEATQQCKPSVAFHHAQDVVIDGFFIANISVENRASCSHRCYLEPRCLSHNYQNDNTAKTNDQNCQLSSSTLDRHPKLAKKRPGWSYSKLEVLDKDKVKVKRDIDDCYLHPCRNEGTCIDGDDYYKCSCKPGYSGKNCETNIDDCSPNPCENGATCTDGVNSYKCSCKPGYNGKNCEKNVDDCSPNPCQNGANCTDGVDSYNCSCKPGFSGTNCETNIDDCSPNPCKNGGTCTDGVESYNCSCKPWHNGTNCEELRLTCSNAYSLGVADSDRIPDSRFSATSYQSMPSSARLHGQNCGWLTVNRLNGEYLQVDLGQLFLVCGVATQGGAANCIYPGGWTTKYKISLSLENAAWNIYQWNGADKIFDGNTDCCTVVKNFLPEPTKARYIRFIPTASVGWRVLRVDVFGWNV